MTSGYEGSRQQYEAVRESDVMAPMRDGVRLAADIYRPAIGGVAVDGEFPVLLERTPYDKSAPGCSARGKYFARRGYVCVIQDVRGRFASEGDMVKSCVWRSGGFLGGHLFPGDLDAVLEDDSSH
ncbi:CocE/NonD family hydrolase, partial [Candidatus Poribacteria bacterium]|nr:CocE/NonD family hydrolase [Candidatus Poribacteria bacterium]